MGSNPDRMANLNLMGSFQTSTGERLQKSTIDFRIKKAKKQFTDQAKEDGKSYCWSCGTTRDQLSCSHIISVNQCQNDGRAEMAYDVRNLQLECIPCHKETESRNINHHANFLYKSEFIEYYNSSSCKAK